MEDGTDDDDGKEDDFPVGINDGGNDGEEDG